MQGRCELEGVCSFPDPNCLSGRRYGALAATASAGDCVVGPGVVPAASGSGSDSGSADPSTSGDSSAGPDSSPSTSGAADDASSTSRAVPPGSSGDDGPSGSSSDSTSGGDLGPPITESFGEIPDEADYTGVTVDTFIDPSSMSCRGSSGSLEYFPSTVALLRFDLSAIPPGRRVSSAQLRLHTGVGNPQQVTVHRVRQPWGDSGSDCATWTHAGANEPWMTPGAAPPGSRDAEAIGLLIDPPENTTFTVSLNAQIVDAWVDDPSSNYGMAIVGEGPSPGFANIRGAQYVLDDRRPLLTVTHAAE